MLEVPSIFCLVIQWNPSNPDTNWSEESVHVSEVSFLSGVKLNARTVLGKRKGVRIREVASSAS